MEKTTKIKKRKRSAAYPAVNLVRAIEGVKKLNDGYSEGPYNRETVALGMGYKNLSGASIVKVAALVHYGLLDRTKSSYSLSDLGKRILFSTSDKDERLAIIQAAKSPKLFHTLLKAYTEKSIPSKFSNILIINHGINKNVANQVAQNFIETMEFSGLLENGVILESALSEDVVMESDLSQKNIGEPCPNKKDGKSTDTKKVDTDSAHLHTVFFDSGIKLMVPIPNSKISKIIGRGGLANIIDEIEKFEIKHKNEEDGDS